jgi:hypothetical protein
MIIRATRLRIPLKSWLEAQIIEDPALDRLAISSTDWKKLKYLIVLLRPFAEYTHLIGGAKDSTINHTWNVYNSLFDHLEQVQTRLSYKNKTLNPWITEFTSAIDVGLAKLKDYYSKTGGPVENQYALAAMLDPSQKLEIFSTPEWGRTYSKRYRQEFLDHWVDHYKEAAEEQSDSDPHTPHVPRSLNSIFRMNRQTLAGRPRRSTAGLNEAEQYLRAPLVSDETDASVLSVWKSLELSYPSVAKMARDILAVPGEYQQ